MKRSALEQNFPSVYLVRISGTVLLCRCFYCLSFYCSRDSPPLVKSQSAANWTWRVWRTYLELFIRTIKAAAAAALSSISYVNSLHLNLLNEITKLINSLVISDHRSTGRKRSLKRNNITKKTMGSNTHTDLIFLNNMNINTYNRSQALP